MTDPPRSAPPATGESDMTASYVRVIVVQVLVIAALWLLGRAFS
jgi:hypothetical protein